MFRVLERLVSICTLLACTLLIHPLTVFSLVTALVMAGPAFSQEATVEASQPADGEMRSTALPDDGVVPVPALLERIGEILGKYFYDEEERLRVPERVARYARKLHDNPELAERDAAFEMLSEIKVSHLGLLSKSSHKRMFDDLWGRPAPTLGFELVEADGRYFTANILESGPAARAGLVEGRVVLALNGTPPEPSGLLDFRTDDAALPDLPQHFVVADEGECVTLSLGAVSLNPGRPQTLGGDEVTVCAESYSAFEAFLTSASVREVEGRSIGYVHLWQIHMTGIPEALDEMFASTLADAEVLILDLRGRGGSAAMIQPILSRFKEGGVWRKPVVALVDGNSRSAKDILAYELREQQLATLVGERTAGAVIPAMFADVGPDTYLMFPARRLDPYTDLLEGQGVEPHVLVEVGDLPEPGDPILEAGWRVALSKLTVGQLESSEELQ